MEVIGILVQAYETRHDPIGAPEPVEAIRFRMEQSGLGVKNLMPFIGPGNPFYHLSSSMVSRVVKAYEIGE